MSTDLKFSDLDPALSAESLAAIAEFGFTHMTPVQASTIPYFLKNKDVCVEATTGSGKTLAFGLPIFEIIRRALPENGQVNKHDTYALIMAPTRELATQIYDVIQRISKYHLQLKCVLMVGGTHVNECCTMFEEEGGQIIIGTPGRILDVKTRIPAMLTFKKLEVLVLDEADTLLDMGFKDTINQLLAFLPKQRRTGLFSATQTKEVRELARAGLRNPVAISVRVQSKNNNNNQNATNDTTTMTNNTTNNNIQQTTPSTLENCYIICEHDQRPDELVNFINSYTNKKIIVFCATCACVDYYSNVFEQLAKKGKVLPLNMNIMGFHGKMIPKKRTILYKKFLSSSSGVMFSTDVAARGIDIPDVDWIVQLAAPRDPAFFVHRVGRTARAGRIGGALLFVTPEEQSYVDLLRGRGVPLRERPRTTSNTDTNTTTIETAGGTTSNCRSELLKEMKLLAMHDRTILECGSTAFMAFLRAYKEHMCSYIFRFDQLDIGAVARAYALLRLPKIPETRGVKGKPIDFEITNVDTSLIPYIHKEQEEARQRRLLLLYQEAEKEEKYGKKVKNTKNPDIADTENLDEPSTTKFIPHDIFLPITKEEKRINDQNRKRKQKGGLHKKIMDEWDELAAEEMAYKKFKKGLISKKEYENCLFSEKKLALDPITGEPLLMKDENDDSSSYDSSSNSSEEEEGKGNNKRKNSSNSGDMQSDDDSDNDDTDDTIEETKVQGKKKTGGEGSQKKKKMMKLQYRDDSDNEETSNQPHHTGNAKKSSNKGGGKGKGDYRRVKSGKSFKGSSGKRPQHRG